MKTSNKFSQSQWSAIADSEVLKAGFAERNCVQALVLVPLSFDIANVKSMAKPARRRKKTATFAETVGWRCTQAPTYAGSPPILESDFLQSRDHTGRSSKRMLMLAGGVSSASGGLRIGVTYCC
jgi:hypothetical protein